MNRILQPAGILKPFHSFALSALLLLASASAGAVTISAEQFVDETSQDLLATIRKEKEHYYDDPDRFVRAITDEMKDLVDMRVATRRVMGAHYQSASRDQRSRFAIRFRDQLLTAFAKAVAEFEFDSIEVTGSKQKEGSRQAVVTMAVAARSGKVDLDYYLYQARSGDWKLYNIRIEGADLTSTYVGQFRSLMAAHNDIDKVIEHWGE